MDAQSFGKTEGVDRTGRGWGTNKKGNRAFTPAPRGAGRAAGRAPGIRGICPARHRRQAAQPWPNGQAESARGLSHSGQNLECHT